MANAFKKKTASADSCVYYSFTEFSHMAKACEPPACIGSRFVGGAVNPNDIDPHAIEENQTSENESDQVDRLVEEAFTKGLDQGRSEIRVVHREKVDQATFALKTAIEEFSRLREKDVARMETETVRLALAIAKKIIGAEASQGTVIAHVVKKAMQRVTDPRYLTLRLNPKDIETVRKLKDGDLIGSEINAEFRLEEDESILQGGCLIETKLGDVDARLDQQIKIIEELLIAQLPKGTL